MNCVETIKDLGDKRRGFEPENDYRDPKIKPYFFSVAGIAGVSYDDILRQYVVLADTPGISVEDQMYEHYLIATIVLSDDSSELIDAVREHQYLSRSVALAKQTWGDSSADHFRYNGRQAPASSKWHELIIASWRDSIQRAAQKNDEKLIEQAIDCGLLFMLEKWCMVADEADAIGTCH